MAIKEHPEPVKHLTSALDHGKEISSVDCNKVARYLQTLEDECERELRLVQDLMSLQCLEAGTHPLEMTPIALDVCILNNLKPFQALTQSRQQILHVDLAANLPLVTTDSFCLNRILTELVNNAFKYTPPGETITISAHTEGEMVYLSVINSGVEIAAEECDRIFDQFYRIPNHALLKNGGTGLGLSLIKKLVEYIHGSIWVSSQNNLTQFTIRLPIASHF